MSAQATPSCLSAATPRPRPRLTPVNRFYWEAGRQGILEMLRCQACGAWLHPPRPICSRCLSENVTPEAVAGSGAVFSITINYQSWVPGIEVPYAIARIALDGVDGVLLTTNIVGDGATKTMIGDRVQVCFEEQDGIWFPLFASAPAPADG